MHVWPPKYLNQCIHGHVKICLCDRYVLCPYMKAQVSCGPSYQVWLVSWDNYYGRHLEWTLPKYHTIGEDYISSGMDMAV